MVRRVAHSLKQELRKEPGVAVGTFASLGSGLARYDLYDWSNKVHEIARDFRPDIAVAVLGTADDQSMKKNGEVLPFGSPRWKAEYATRVRTVIDTLVQGGCRTIVWLGLPDMRDDAKNRGVHLINALFQDICADHPSVIFLDVAKVLSTKPGAYSPYIQDEHGMPVHVRSSDGIHLSSQGGLIVAGLVMDKIRRDLE